MKQMKIGFFVVSTELGGQLELGEEIHSEVREILSEISQKLKISGLITTSEMAEKSVENFKNEINGAVVLVATGGTDDFIKTMGVELEKPTLILAYPSNNSLPASLESFAFLRDEDLPVRISYTELGPSMADEIESFSRTYSAISELNDSRLGLVGEEERWILMRKEEDLIRNRIGPSLKRFDLTEFLAAADEQNSERAHGIADELSDKFGEVEEPGAEELTRAAEIYLAMKELILGHDLSAIAVSHDLIKHGVIGCIGASLCNDEGTPAGYEVDPLAMLTMMIVSFISGEPNWMANPVRIDKDSNELTLAHCEVPMEMLKSLDDSVLRSYFDSREDESAAIQGPLEERVVTIARLGGQELDKMQIAKGRIVKSDMRDPNLCRTQAVVRLEGDVEEFIQGSLGNHHILTYGDLISELQSFCDFKGIEPILVK